MNYKKTLFWVIVILLCATFISCNNGEHQHSWSNWMVDVESTCIKKGSSYRECAICGQRETRDLNETGEHSYYTTITPPTTICQGYTTHTCQECGDSFIDNYVPRIDSVGLLYKVNSDCKTCTITGRGVCIDREIGIPETIDGYKVTAIGDRAFGNDTYIKGIYIPDSVTSIGDGVFSGCTSLESITLPFVGVSMKTSSNTYQYPFGYIFGTSSYAGGVAIEQYYYIYRYNSTYTTWDTSTYYIPASLKSVTITGGNILHRGAFYNCSRLISVTIPDSVTSIDDDAFYGCTGLTSIAIPDSVTSIGSSAFYGCTGLTSIAIPDSVTSIGSSAFYGCTGLTSIVIPDSVTSIGDSAFSGCSSLTSITVQDGNTKYHSAGNCLIVTNSKTLIAGCKNSVIPTDGSVTSIGSSAFNGCSSLTSIMIPDSVTSIGSSAFNGCSSLTSIMIPDSVTSIGASAFADCSSLESITLPFVGVSRKTSSNTYQYPFGYIFGTSRYTGGVATEQYYYIYNSTYTTWDTSTYYIPASLKSVTITGGNILHKGAFYNCSSLTSVTIGSGVTSIGYGAFQGCSSLTSITLPFVGASKDGTTDTSFGYVFGASSYSSDSSYVPTSLKTVVITGGTTIDYDAFRGCSSLTSIVIPDSVTSIGKRAFYECSSLTSIVIPDSVTSIGWDAFYNCSSLASVTIGSGVTSIGSDAFYKCSSLTSIVIPDGVTSIGSSVFYGCTGLTSIVIPDGVTSIGSSAFSGCSSLTSVTIPNSVTSIGDGAFSGCRGLTSIVIPDSVTSIGYGAFWGCSSLTSVTIGSGVTSIGSYAFEDCSSLTSIVIPDSVTSIGSSAFSGCSSLTSIVIPDSVTSIGSDAFRGCSSLTSVTIGSGVTSIGSYAFEDCSSLTSIIVASGNPQYHSSGNCLIATESKTLIAGCQNSIIPIDGSVTSIGSSAFSGCSSLTSVVIPDSVTSIGSFAFCGCSNLTSVTIGNGVTTLGQYAFAYCTKLSEVTLGTSLQDIGEYAFSGCSSLTSILIPNSVTSINMRAFEECTGLRSVTIGNGVTSIGYQAFYGCTSLTSMIFIDITMWYCTEFEYGYCVNYMLVTNASQNAMYFRSTYASYYWYKQ